MRPDRRRLSLALFTGVRRPRTRKGWLITVATVVVSVAIKVTIGASVVLFIVHSFTR